MTTPETEPGERDPLVKGVRLRGERHRRSLREGEPSVARRLAQIGVLGWIIVVPMLTRRLRRPLARPNVQLRTVLDRAAPDARAGARMLVRLEMDEERMSFLSFDALPLWAMLLSLPAHLAAGIVLGVLYFRSPVVERPPVHRRAVARRRRSP